MSRGSTPWHAQTAGDLGFAVQFNAETLWHFAQLPLDDCCRLVLPYNAVHSIQQTEQSPNDPRLDGGWKVLILAIILVNNVNRSRPRLTSCLLKKQARHQCDVCTTLSDCLVVYNQFVTLKKCMAATVNKFLRSRQENIHKWKFESSWYEQYERRPFCLNFWSL